MYIKYLRPFPVMTENRSTSKSVHRANRKRIELYHFPQESTNCFLNSKMNKNGFDLQEFISNSKNEVTVGDYTTVHEIQSKFERKEANPRLYIFHTLIKKHRFMSSQM